MEENKKILVVGKGAVGITAAEIVAQTNSLPENVIIVDDETTAFEQYHKEALKEFKEMSKNTYVLEALYKSEEVYAAPLTKKQKEARYESIRTEPKTQNNEPCPCGSGKKYKKCCKK